jgi:hypothetical protein
VAPPPERFRSVNLWPACKVRWRCRVAVGGNATWAYAVRCRIWRVVPTSPTSSDRVVLSRHRPSSAIRETVLGDPEGSWGPFRVAL